ncbi:Putative periplasmic protein [Campylobacter insulaenigrae]|uniref:DUF6844 domain-containing protein n=1 Tax=Campylobacter insulaenigrae TaxID=260714 RepID=UPI000F6F901D|nr:hypothetical protein [Campylobacter insulaenigrae]MCR6591703.1 hypothetical protein [Campylobacter insulaenigrae]MCR6593217.1 hypothetical protein [Campylobacter insulaenigrae]VEJ52524.1 Putative periplasmic protein [Campylobacter insulaenigrae]
MKKILWIGFLCLANFIFAQDEITQEDVKIQNEISSINENMPKNLDDFFNEFKEQYGIEYGQTEKGRTFYIGRADVLVNDTDPQFSKALQLSYQKALLNLQVEFIKDAFGRMSAEKISNYEADNSTNAREFEELSRGGTFSQIIDKVTQLAGAKLDKALQDMGINVSGLTEERKKTLFKEQFLIKNLTSAFGSMSGLIPVQTIITQKRGEYQVGVIAVISNKTRQIAKDMSLGRKSLIVGKGRSINDYLPKDEKSYLNEYGIRLIYDENGAPVILSYGNWGFVPNANNKMTNRLEDDAKKNASTQADAAILEFVNTNLSFKDERVAGEHYEELIKQNLNINDNSVQDQEQTIANIIDKVKTQIKASASGKLRGIRTLKTWNYTGENGVEFVGAVRYYSYDNLKNTNEALNSNQNQEGKNQQTPKNPANIQRKSNVVNDIDDF